MIIEKTIYPLTDKRIPSVTGLDVVRDILENVSNLYI